MIDIIIPVFNAWQQARACVQSVLAHTDPAEATVWIIDDASTDPRIGAWLDALAETGNPQVQILRNEHNLGFVQTVNRGMSRSRRDVVLLNSDTLVTPHWLQRLRECADSDPQTATVTPFSNNAEICSYPAFCQNTRVEGLVLDGLLRAIDAAFDGSHPEIPTAVGFCMFIKRAALDAVGLFDAERFGKGYGEENDFCWRARKAGWVHRLCTNAWVSHLGGQSFAERTPELKQHHLQRLLEIHPDYSGRIAEFIAQDPIAPARQRIANALAGMGLDALGRPHQPGVLLVTHAMGGGVERHVQDLLELIGPHVRTEVMTPRGDDAVCVRDTLGNERIVAADATSIAGLLKSRGYRRLHIHHLHGYPLAFAQALVASGIAFDITVHDFGFWCPQYNLSTAEGRYCGEPDAAGCARCLAQRPHAWGQTIDAWRTMQAAWLRRAARVIAPSRFVANALSQRVEGLTPEVWPHPPRHEWLAPVQRPIRIGVVGGLSVAKGLDEVVRCAAFAAVRECPVEFTIVGHTARRIPVWPDLPVRITGQYEDADLPALLQRLDLDCIWLPGIIPESYSYTLDAALQTGLPVLASDASGAVAQRLAASGAQHRVLSVGAPAQAVVETLQALASRADAAPAPTADTALAAQRTTYLAQWLAPIKADASAPATVDALPLLRVSGEASLSAQTDRPTRSISLPALLEQAMDCGHQPSLKVLRKRLREIDNEFAALDALAQREGRPWFEHLDLLHAERATLYREQERLNQMIHDVTTAASTAAADAERTVHALHQEIEQQKMALHARDAELELTRKQLQLYSQFFGVRVFARLYRALNRRMQRLLDIARSLRRLAGVLARGVRRWPVALSILRHEGPSALWQRVRVKLWPSVDAASFVPPPVASVIAPTTESLAPLALPACPESQVPRISIVIPVYGQHGYTYQCLQSIAQYTVLDEVEILVIDDASPEPARAALSMVEGVRWLLNERNLGFVRSCNAAAAQARGEFLVLLNNDVQVSAGWLEALLRVFEQRSDAGLAGAKLIYPDGRLQEAGGIVWRDGSAWNWGRLQDPSHPDYQSLRTADYCSGACLMLRTALWRELGGFDTAFVPAYYEDTDMAFRVRATGLQVYYQPACQVIHYEGITSGTDETRGIKRHQVINHQTFYERWRPVLANWQANGIEPLRAVRRAARARVLIVEACMITPDQDSGSVRMLAMLRILVSLGAHVTFIADNLEAREPYTSQLRAEGVDVWHAPYVHSVAQLLQERGSLYDVVMLCRHYIAAPLVPAVRKYAPQAQLWFDTVDLHYLREERQAALENSQAMLRTARQTRDQELGVIEAADLTLVVSPVEQQVLAQAAPHARVEILSNIHDVHADTPGFDVRDGLLFVGGFQHPPNVDAVTWFVEQVWPLVRAAAPALTLRVVGSKMPDRLRSLHGNGIEILGFVHDIEPLLRSSKVSIAPLRYGAGVKGKVNQAMAYGLPVVATSVAVEGMGLRDGEHVRVADTPQAFADAVLKVHSDRTLWEALARGGLRNVDETFSSRVAQRVLARLLEPHAGQTIAT